MAEVNKVDSNVTELRFAEEPTFKGAIPGTGNWFQMEPNSYADFGGQLTTLVRNPIAQGRQQKKGVITDLDASGGLNTDLTQDNLTTLLQGFIFADIIDKTAVGILMSNDPASPAADTLELPTAAVDASGTLPRITDVAITAGIAGSFVPGEWVFVGGDVAGDRFLMPTNNGFKRVRSAAAGYIELDKSEEAMVTEATTRPVDIYVGRVLKNQVGSAIRRRSYKLERTLGFSDDAHTQPQAEYLDGAVANEITMNIASADKITFDLSFVATDHETVDSVMGAAPGNLKAGMRPTLVDADAFNTSSDFSRIRLARVLPGNVAPDPLFAFISGNNPLREQQRYRIEGRSVPWFFRPERWNLRAFRFVDCLLRER